MHRGKRIETVLQGIEFPGEQQEELRGAANDPALTDRIMDRVAAEAQGERYADAQVASRYREERPLLATREESETGAGRAWPWIAALLGNLGLLLFFGVGEHPSATLILGGGEFFSTMVFLFLGISMSVSVAGAVLSCDLTLLRRAAAALGLES